MKLHSSITNREFKLLIKPSGLDRRSPITLGLAIITFICILKTKINPVLVILGSGLFSYILLRFF